MLSVAPTTDVRPQVDLRRLDWRYLLPRPGTGEFRQLVLLGGDEALADSIVSLGIARSVSLRLPEKPTADAIIALHPSQPAPEHLARSLAPGGVFYTERVRSATPAALARRRFRSAFERAGLASRVYWARPDFYPCQMVIPLDVPGALRWYLATLYAPSSRVQSALGQGVRALAQLDARPVLPASRYVVTGRAGRPQSGEDLVYAHPALPMRGDLYPLIIGAGNATNRVVVAPFSAQGQRPEAIVKLARHPALNARVEAEQLALARLHATLDEPLRQTLPQPIGQKMWGDLAVGVETCAPGRPLSAISRTALPAEHITHLRTVADWLTRFHCAAQLRDGIWTATDIQEWVDMPLAEYEAIFGVTAGERRLFEEVRRRAHTLAGAALPVVWNHWGFEDRNLFLDGPTLTVIDWEGGSPGPPLFDLLYFVLRWYESGRRRQGRAAPLSAFSDLFLGRNGGQIGAAARDAIERYMAALHLDRRFFPVLLALLWVHRALGRVKADGSLRMRGGDARVGNSYVDYVSLLADNVERLFDGGEWPR
ncbi:MAG: phosphotransferase [Anaerolineae bacterium]